MAIRNPGRPRSLAGGGDPRETPAYTVSEAATYLRIPPATVRAWVAGLRYHQGPKPRFFRPVLQLPPSAEKVLLLSFINLVEAHVLVALRREHGLSLQKIRTAISYLRKSYPHVPHPLANHDVLTDGLDVWVDRLGTLIAASRHGQLGIRPIIEAHLQRIDRGEDGIALRLYPFVRSAVEVETVHDLREQPRNIVIDPTVSFGRPVLTGTGIPTEVIAQRHRAGEDIARLADDYGQPQAAIEDALRWELRPAA
jgi:uncharacterized protein (DUF433 family)